jgi:universal stress protein A
MNVHSILFPTDFSQYNDAALQYASSLAAETGATLHIVHVQDPRSMSTMTGEASSLYSAVWQEEAEKARELLEGISPTRAGVHCEHHCIVGIPEDEIVSFASENDCDLIIMASHGRTGLSRLLMGSVAEQVMRRAHCPVLIIKQPVAEKVPTPTPAKLAPK